MARTYQPQLPPPAAISAGPMCTPESESDSWFGGMQDLLGNAGLLELVNDPSLLLAELGAGGAPGTSAGDQGAEGAGGAPVVAAPEEDTRSPVRRIIDEQLDKHKDKETPEQLDAAIKDTSAWRRANDPDNKNTDWAAADHYIYGRKMTADMSDWVGDKLSPWVGEEVGDTAGAIAGTAGGLLVGGVLVPGYDAYKAVGYGMKDLGEWVGWDGLAGAGDGMLKGVTNGELPSRPTLKSVGWGMLGAVEGIGDGWSAAWDSWTGDRRKTGDMDAW